MPKSKFSPGRKRKTAQKGTLYHGVDHEGVPMSFRRVVIGKAGNKLRRLFKKGANVGVVSKAFIQMQKNRLSKLA
jgi:hypothetical protein